MIFHSGVVTGTWLGHVSILSSIWSQQPVSHCHTVTPAHCQQAQPGVRVWQGSPCGGGGARADGCPVWGCQHLCGCRKQCRTAADLIQGPPLLISHRKMISPKAGHVMKSFPGPSSWQLLLVGGGGQQADESELDSVLTCGGCGAELAGLLGLQVTSAVITVLLC